MHLADVFLEIQPQYTQAQTQHYWTIMGIIIGVLSLLTAIVVGIAQINLAQPKEKTLRCILVRYAQWEEIHYLTARKMFSFTLKVINSGGSSIQPKDFITSLKCLFYSGTKILDIRIFKTEPISLTPQISVIKDSFEVLPLLLNPGDSFFISLVAAGAYAKPNISARITGVKFIGLETTTSKRRTKQQSLIYITFFCFLLCIGVVISLTMHFQ